MGQAKTSFHTVVLHPNLYPSSSKPEDVSGHCLPAVAYLSVDVDCAGVARTSNVSCVYIEDRDIDQQCKSLGTPLPTIV